MPLHPHEFLQLPNRLSDSVHVLSKLRNDVRERICSKDSHSEHVTGQHVHVHPPCLPKCKQSLPRKRRYLAWTHFQSYFLEPIRLTDAFPNTG